MRIHISSPSTDCWFCQDQTDRNLHSVLLSAWRPREETSALGVSGTCAPSPGRRWHGTVKETGAQCGGREEAAKESLSGTRMGLLAPFSPLRGQSLGSPSSHSDHVLGWPKISFPIPSYGKTRTNILAYRHLFCQSVWCLLCAGQPEDTGEVVATVRHDFRSPSAPTIMVEGQGDDHHHAARWGRCASRGEWGPRTASQRGLYTMKPEGVS